MDTLTLVSNGVITTYFADGTMKEEVIPPYQPSIEKITVPVWYMSEDVRIEEIITIPKPNLSGRRSYDPLLEIQQLCTDAFSRQFHDVDMIFATVPSQNLRDRFECVHLDTLVENADFSFEVIWRKR